MVDLQLDASLVLKKLQDQIGTIEDSTVRDLYRKILDIAVKDTFIDMQGGELNSLREETDRLLQERLGVLEEKQVSENGSHPEKVKEHRTPELENSALVHEPKRSTGHG